MTHCSWLLATLVCSAAYGELPRAVVTGPKDARPGSLVVLDATASVGLSRAWILAASPEETSFLPVEGGLKCIFASPTPGKYQFVLVVAGTNQNGGAAVDMAVHVVTILGAAPPIAPPEPPPDPTRPPSTRPTAAVYIYEKDRHSPPRAVQAALDKINRDGVSGVVGSLHEQDATTGDGQVPAQYRTQLQAARAAGLPALVVSAGDQVLRVIRDPQTEADVMEAVR